MLPSAAPKNKKLVFFPYWRFKGMLFSCVESGIKHRFIDASHQAVESGYFPISVGLRSQALKLNFVVPETQGYFLKPTRSFNKVMDIFKHRFSTSLPKPIYHQSHIGETLSLIYSPFYAEDKLFDAILNKPVSSVLPDDFDVTVLQGGRPDERINFIPTLCPACGWDLEGRRGALVLNCKNCNSAWRPDANGLKELKFGFIPAKEKNIDLSVTWENEVKEDHFDPDRIEQVLTNLIDNALRHTNSGGFVKLTIQKTETGLKMDVQDSGSGIREEDLPFVFERFYKADKARTRGRSGTGLGLAIAKNIVDAHNGNIHVHSKLNEGTTFSIYLPS